MEKKKELVLNDFVDMIKKSWTYDKLTQKEKDNLLTMFNHNMTTRSLKGNYKQRWATLQAIYYSYLCALDYNGNEINWREENE